MATLGSRLKTAQMPWHAGMTELNHLGAALAAKPVVFEGKMNQLFSATNYFSDNPLSSIAWTGGAEKTITSNSWEWKLMGATEKPLVCVVKEETATKPGQYNQPFSLALNDNWYVPGDVLSPGTSGQKYQSRVKDNPVPKGNYFLYSMELVSTDTASFVPADLLNPGQQWTKLYSTYGEGDNQDGSTVHTGGLSLRDSLGKFRKKYEVTDYAAEEVLAVAMQDTNGGTHTSWIKLAEVDYWKQWYRELERAYWYNRASTKLLSVTGRKVDTFSGIQEKLEDSHLHYYSVLTARLIEDFLMDIFYSRVKPGAARKIKAFTGEFGMILFSRAMNDLMAKRGWTIANSNFNPIKQTTSQYNSNAYSIGYQFVTYVMENGAELELVHNPLYDDRTINFEIDPITGYPVESMRFTFLDFSGGDGSSNIKLINKQNGFKSGYVAGLVGPYGPTKGGLMAHQGEYYSMHVSKECGVHIEDITKCGELILRRA